METVSCFSGVFLMALPLSIFIVKDIKPFINEITSWIGRRQQKTPIENENHASLLITDENSIAPLNIEQKNIEQNQEIPVINEPLSSHIEDESLDHDQHQNQQPQIKSQQYSDMNLYVYSSINTLLEYSSIITWFGTLLFGYTLSRVVAELFDYRRNFKYAATHFQDIIDMCIRSFLIYILGNIACRFETNRMKLKFFLCVIYFLMVYEFTFQNCPGIKFAADGLSADTASVVIMITIFALIGLYLAVRNCYNLCIVKESDHEAIGKRKRKIFWVFFVLIVLFNIAMIIIGSTDHVNIHIHHHYWTFLVALFFRSDNKAIFMIQALVIAMMIHGISIFGCSDLYSWKNVNTQYFEDKCSGFQCEEYGCSLPK